MKKNWIALFLILVLGSCRKTADSLPYIGNDNENKPSPKHIIGKFEFINSEGKLINQETTAGKVYVADFFFTSCPTICPVMKSQMLRVYNKFKTQDNFMILSHTIDPEHDSLSVLKDYKKRLLGEPTSQWQFLRSEKMYTHQLAQKRYFVSALEDKTDIESGGFVHSGAFVLVDKNQNIRGLYDGTKADQVDKLIDDIEILLR